MAGKEFPLSVVIKAVDRATAPVRQFNERMKRLAEPVKRLGAAFRGFSKEMGFPKLMAGFARVGSAVGNVGREVTALGFKLAALASLAGFAFYRMVKSATDGGDALAKLADRLGFTINGLAEYQFVAGRAGMETEVFNKGIETLSKNVGELKAGTGTLKTLLDKISPSFARQLKDVKNNEEAMLLLVGAIRKLEDPQKKMALARAAFGRAGSKFLNVAEEDIEGLRAEYRRLMGDQEEFARLSEEYNDMMGDTELAFAGLRNAALTELLPTLTQLVIAVKEMLVSYRPMIAEWSKEFAAKLPDRLRALRDGFNKLRENLAPITGAIKAITDRFGVANTIAAVLAVTMGFKLIVAVGQLAAALVMLNAALLPVIIRLGVLAAGGIMAVVASVGNFIYALRAGTGVMWAFNFALMANPIAIVITAIAALAGAAYLVYKSWAPIKKFFADLWESISRVVGAAQRFGQGIGQKFKSIFGSGSDSSAAPTLGASRAAPPPAGAAKSEATVNVNFENMPRGARVTTDPRSDADLNTSLGYSMLAGAA